MHVGAVEVRERRPDVLAGDVAEELVAEDRRAAAAQRLLAQVGPGALDPLLRHTPAGVVAGELERGVEHPAMLLRRVPDALRLEPVGVLPQRRLEERRTALGDAHVHDDARPHRLAAHVPRIEGPRRTPTKRCDTTDTTDLIDFWVIGSLPY